MNSQNILYNNFTSVCYFPADNFPENEIYKFDENPASLVCSTVNIREEYKASMGLDLRSIYTNRTFEEDYEAFINVSYNSNFIQFPIFTKKTLTRPNSTFFVIFIRIFFPCEL